jgi:predicted ribosome quality control (RQC) complex YloA/Tae2 family protein
MDVEIDLSKSVSENAAVYYERSKKARGKIDGAEKSLTETREAMDSVKTKQNAETESFDVGAPAKKSKRRWFEAFRWFTSSDGFLVVGGRDATSNEVLLKKHAGGRDVVFHANVQGAPFFVVKNDGDTEIPERTLSEAVGAAASYSSGWKNGLGSCDVYMVEPSQLSKTPESGEYLTKGAFVVRGERRWFNNTPLEIAVGYDASEGAILSGPPSAVSAKTQYYVVLSPGGLKSSELAETVKKAIQRKTGRDAGAALKKIPAGEIQRALPSGGGSIVAE